MGSKWAVLSGSLLDEILVGQWVEKWVVLLVPKLDEQLVVP